MELNIGVSKGGEDESDNILVEKSHTLFKYAMMYPRVFFTNGKK